MPTLLRTRGTTRLVALAAALLACAGQVATLRHQHSTAHTVCPEHGELVDVDAPAHAGPTANAPVRTAIGASVDGEREHGHEHCDYVTSARTPWTPLSRVDVAVGRVIVLELPSWTQSPSAPAIAVLRLAPKNSPPNAV